MRSDITVGLVCEGPRDQEMLEAVMDKLFPEVHFQYRYLQPDVSLSSGNYNGWPGVLRWCYKDAKNVAASNKALTNGIDLIVVQIDGDVSRTEKKVHCDCSVADCSMKEELRAAGKKLELSGHTRSVECAEIDCPVELPCKQHSGKKPDEYAEHLTNIVKDYLEDIDDIPMIITVPCDNTDAWIVAAFDEVDNPELIEKPWETVISHNKVYHGIRCRKKKSKDTMRQFLPVVAENWEKVTMKCSQARKLEEDLRKARNEI